MPTLRFPEFLDKDEWQTKKLIDTADKKIKWSFIGGPFGSNLKSSDYVERGVRIIQLQNIGDGEFLDDYKIYTSEEKANELLSNNIYPGDIILSKMGDPVGRACLIPNAHNRYVMCSDGIRLVVDEKKYSKYFVYSLINSVQFRSLVEKTATGSTRKRIGLDELKNLPIGIPAERVEQQKIADCLTSVDELITAQTQKLVALKTHKKGLMQQLFPAEGETVPKRRFPEFRHAEEWEEKFIRDLGEIITGSTPSTTKPEYYGGDRLFVSPADISDQRFIEKTKTTLTELGFNETRPVKPGSILFVCIGSTIGKIAQNRHECATNQQINAVVPSANYANAFIYYSLENNSEKISGLAGNHAVPIINKTAFGAVGIRFPKLPEQQKIADCLSSVDELITAQTQKLDALETHKKGLMQQLFPAMDEVSA